ncbi:hypothetical protein SLE2022_259960 [Rubroshorea leprosula]|uniref:Uncharacterized protein n=1 Tax=Rubroshorea leprosula TaxID=152421 RepID=A0AAV5M0F3_9ROSI|nr:hypothetical protein SLEP1_g50553 [Rubroshorea leprosula]
MAIAARIGRSKIFLLGEAKRGERSLSRLAGGDLGEKSRRGDNEGNVYDSSSWVPHPRNGIYFPKGHEWVMNDVPEGAACFDRGFWVRNTDGVEKPDPEVPAPNYQHLSKVT